MVVVFPDTTLCPPCQGTTKESVWGMRRRCRVGTMTETMANQVVPFADRFLQEARDSQMSVSLYLVNGFQLKGEIIDFDAQSILFKHKNICQIVTRSAVASMYPLPKSKGYTDNWWRQYTSTSEAEQSAGNSSRLHRKANR